MRMIDFEIDDGSVVAVWPDQVYLLNEADSDEVCLMMPSVDSDVDRGWVLAEEWSFHDAEEALRQALHDEDVDEDDDDEDDYSDDFEDDE